MDTGGLSVMRRISEVREPFERAVALAPQDYAMRRDLRGFYRDVPALLGGSDRKAREQAAGDNARAADAYRRELADPANSAAADKTRARLMALQQ